MVVFLLEGLHVPNLKRVWMLFIILMIRLLCTDFDGTIFNEAAQPFPISRRFLKDVKGLKERGASWVISTGRDRHEMVATLEHYGVEIWPDFLSTVERELYVRQGNDYVPMEPWNQICRDIHQKLYARIAPLLPPLEQWIKENYSDSILYKDGYSPLCFIANNNPEADVVLRHVADHFASVPEIALVRNDVYARLAHRDYHKGATLLELERHLGLTPAEVCVAGDHYNDISMLDKEIAQNLITPANAIGLVKETVAQHGGYVATLSYADGIAEGLEHLLGGEL